MGIFVNRRIVKLVGFIIVVEILKKENDKLSLVKYDYVLKLEYFYSGIYRRFMLYS